MLYKRVKYAVPPKQPISDSILKDAIETWCSECFVAMLYANAFGGYLTEKWELIHDYKLYEMLEEAERRELPIQEWYCAIPEDMRIIDSPAYKKEVGRMKNPFPFTTENERET